MGEMVGQHPSVTEGCGSGEGRLDRGGAAASAELDEMAERLLDAATLEVVLG